MSARSTMLSALLLTSCGVAEVVHERSNSAAINNAGKTYAIPMERLYACFVSAQGSPVGRNNWYNWFTPSGAEIGLKGVTTIHLAPAGRDQTAVEIDVNPSHTLAYPASHWIALLDACVI